MLRILVFGALLMLNCSCRKLDRSNAKSLTGKFSRSEDPQNNDYESAKVWLENYNKEAEQVYNSHVEASWTYATDITEDNAEAEVRRMIRYNP